LLFTVKFAAFTDRGFFSRRMTDERLGGKRDGDREGKSTNVI